MRFITVFLGLLAFALQPVHAASSPALVSLEQQLRAVVGSASSDVGVAALDLTTGESVSINGNTAFPMASTVKVAVAAAYLSQVDHGRRSLNDKISGQSAASLMERMMIHSDNHATDLLLRDLGGPSGLQDWIAFNGLYNLRVDRTIARLLADKRDLWAPSFIPRLRISGNSTGAIAAMSAVLEPEMPETSSMAPSMT